MNKQSSLTVICLMPLAALGFLVLAMVTLVSSCTPSSLEDGVWSENTPPCCQTSVTISMDKTRDSLEGFNESISQRIRKADLPALAEPSPKNDWKEADYIRALSYRFNWDREIVLEDGTRADLESPWRIWEVELGKDWYESIGQSLHYSNVSGKPPGIFYLYRDEERKYLCRLKAVCERADITLVTQRIK